MPRITDLPELTNPSDDDILVIDDNPASGTTTKKVTKGNLTKDLAKKADLDAHKADTDNPHQVTAEQLGIEPGATANATDAELRDRSTHTGSQAIATVTGLQAAIDGKVNLADLPEALTDLDTVVTGEQLDALKAVVDTITSGMVNGVYINGPSIGELKYIDFSTDNLAESIGFTFRVEDVLKAAFSLYTGNNDFFLDAYNDAGEKILMFAANAQAKKFVVTPYLADGKLGINTYDPSEALEVVGNIAVSGTVDGRDVAADGAKLDDIDEHATANDTDANLRDRATHTGTQPASSISDFNTAADARITVQKGQSNGIATLDGSGKVPSVQLPSFVDDVVEYANTGAFPGTGETAKIYVALDTGKVYRWGGSSYIEISPSPGTTDAVPEGATNLYYPAADKAKLAGIEAGAQVNDVSSADIADFETTTQLNARDTANRDRVNHTGTQAISTITGLQTALDGKSAVGHTHDDRYYTEAEADTLLSAKADTSLLAPVATSGDFADLSNRPTLGTAAAAAAEDFASAAQGALADTAVQPADLGAVAISNSYDDLDDKPTLITQGDIDDSIAALVDTAPGTLNTLNELAAALGDDPNFATTISTQVGAKADASALTSHTGNTSNPHSVTKAQVGLSNVPNTDATNRANHTGTQAQSTITNLTADLASKQPRTIVTVGTVDADYITDGAADDVQIQTAIDAVNTAGGGTVFLKAGTYTIASSVLLKSKVTLRGAGQGSTIITGPASDVSLVRTTLSGTTKTVYNSITVRDLTFKSAYGSGLVIDNTDGVLVTGCEFTFTSTTPIRQTLFIQHCRNVVVSENYAHDYTGNGLSVTSTDYFTIANNVIVAGANGDDGIDVDYDFLDTSAIHSTYGTVTGNVVKDIGRGNGIRIENSDWITVSGNTVNNVTPATGITAGILVNASSSNSAKHITVVGNSVSNCVSVGIGIDGTNLTEVVVVGNTVEDCGQTGGSNPRAGILLGAAGVLCANNLVDTTAKTGTDSAGVLIYKKDGHLIQNNIIKGCATGLRTWNGDGSQSYTSLVISGNRFDSNTANAVTTAATSASRIFNNYGLSDLDATTTTKGVIQLAGDLGGTAAAPTVTGLSGKVTGPASATDNAITRFDATTGKLIQNSAVTISDGGMVDIGAYGSPEVLAGAMLLVKADSNAINGVEMKNVNAGTGADFRFLIKDTTGHYLAFAQPGVGNTAAALFGLARATTDFLFSNAGTARTLAMGTLQAADLVFGTNGTERLRIAADGSIALSGSLRTPLATKTANYTLTATDSVILADATAGAITMTLPSAAGIAGRQYTIKRVNSGVNAVGIATTSSQTIDGATTMSLTSQWQSVTVVSNGMSWLVV